MVFGILGVVFGLSCGIGGLLGIPGIMQGRKARDEIDAEPGRYSGRSQAVAGIVTGIIGVVIAALVIVIGVVARHPRRLGTVMTSRVRRTRDGEECCA